MGYRILMAKSWWTAILKQQTNAWPFGQTARLLPSIADDFGRGSNWDGVIAEGSRAFGPSIRRIIPTASVA